MLGTIVIGAVAATWINIKTGFTMTAAGADKPFLVLQNTLDGVFPNILSAAFVILCWYLMAKRKNVADYGNAASRSDCIRRRTCRLLRYGSQLLMVIC